MFEQASNIVINGGHFYYDGSTWHVGQTPEPRVLDSLKRIVQKDAHFNKYSSTDQTLALPLLTKDLLLNVTEVTTNAGNRPASISCCFELMRRLGFLPGQQNSGFVEYEEHIPIPRVVTRNSCCCALISRHGFVHLVSRFFQDVSAHDSPGATSTITINTTIGRFRCYEIDDRTFVHFDGSIRAVPKVELVDNQDLDHILRAAHGQYWVMIGAAPHLKEWKTLNEDDMLATAACWYLGQPNAIMYMSGGAVTTWTLLNKFSRLMGECTLDYISALQALMACTQLQDFDKEIGMTDLADALSGCTNGLHQMKGGNPIDMTIEGNSLVPVHIFGSVQLLICAQDHQEFYLTFISTLFKNPQHYMGEEALAYKVLELSLVFFLEVFHACCEGQDTREIPMKAAITSQLQSRLLSRVTPGKNDIALLAYQIFCSLVAYGNSNRILARARSASGSWNQFLSAEDDYVYLG